jgi:arginyl-tRNA synthetase
MIKNEIKKIIVEAIKTAQKAQKLPVFAIPEIDLESPKEARNGDYASNIALVLTKSAKKKPAEIAEILVKSLSKDSLFKEVRIAQPGFINFILADNFLQKKIQEIIKQKEKFGNSTSNKNKKIQVEFVSANPTGPVHIGNARGGPLGDILSNVLARTGYKVTREYYVNDAGNQVDILGHSILKDEEKVYQGKYIDDLDERIKSKNYYQAGEEGAKIILAEMIKPSMKKLGIKFDSWFSEQKLQKGGEAEKAIKLLQKKGLIYEKDGALWFRSTKFGDDKDRVVVKSDGQKTYFGSDIAYHLNKLKRDYNKLINIWGADHHGDVARVKGALEALGYKDKLDVILTQLVKVLKDGKEIKMSKRAGTYISIDDLLSEVGRDAVRFIFAMYSADTHINFDINLATEKSEKNPVYYVQYASARISGILKKAPRNKIQTSKIKFQLLNHPSEFRLIKELIKLPDLIEEIASDYQVQKLPHYALDLAALFHRFYGQCRVISDDQELTAARLALILATQIVLKNTLGLIGISTPERM